METALMPAPPMNWPTIIMSTTLYMACRALDTNRGNANSRSCFATLPFVRSLTIVFSPAMTVILCKRDNRINEQDYCYYNNTMFLFVTKKSESLLTLSALNE